MKELGKELAIGFVNELKKHCAEKKKICSFA